MSLKGLLVGPLVSLLIGVIISSLPIEWLSRSRFIEQDQYGVRTAVVRSYEHIVWSIREVKRHLLTLFHLAKKSLINDRRSSESEIASGAESPATRSRKKDEKEEKKKTSGQRDADSHDDHDDHNTRLFSTDQLAQFSSEARPVDHDDADDRHPLYLSILGRVFDVTSGRRHYGRGGGYAFFSGRDASRAFVTGDFSAAGLTDDVEGLTDTDVLALHDWLISYKRRYRPLGKLVGRFYDAHGVATVQLRQFRRRLAEARAVKQDRRQMDSVFPPCNSEWRAAEAGGGGVGRVYCTASSGGVARRWVGVPRQLFVDGTTRCACVRDRGAPSHSGGAASGDRGDLDSPLLKPYPDCAPTSVSCPIT